ncbi:MAG: aspartate--tRNA ligase [Gammaproteobacteria bacterium]
MRTHLCGEIDESIIGERAIVCGWAHSRRDHGGVIFIDLRDHSGIVQIVADPAASKNIFQTAEQVRGEFVLRAAGVVRARPQGTENNKLPSGRIEVAADELRILNTAAPAPFAPGEDAPGEEVKLRHRVVDLRGAPMQNNLRLRHKAASAARRFLEDNHFVEVETPVLTRATPEGARDFLSPSRLRRGAFYALPQSPQLFKQMLMAGGFERYYQFARCFRDEDLRADRQLEFSQIDIEMAFVGESEVMDIAERMIARMFAAADITLQLPLPRMTYNDAMRDFGSDRPDLRNPLRIIDVGDIMANVEFAVFAKPAQAADGKVAVLRLPGGASMARKASDDLAAFAAAELGLGGLAFIKVDDVKKGAHGLRSPILKFLPEDALLQTLKRTGAEDGDILFFVAASAKVANPALAVLRDKLAAEHNLIADGFCPLWVTDFPMFESGDDNTLRAVHHPFTAPQEDGKDGDSKLAKAPMQLLSRAYDLVVNGAEIGGGSIRIHNPKQQLAVFAALGMDEEESKRKFGFLLNALASGAPPHGGIAFGLDRIAAMLAGTNSIRDVIAFPKTQAGICPLTGAPAEVDNRQLRELGVRIA